MSKKNNITAPILLIVIYLLYLASKFVDAEMLGSLDGLYLSVIILQLIIFILPGIFYCRVKGEGYSVRLNLRPIAPRKIFFVVAAFFTMVFGVVLIRLGLFSAGAYTSRYSLFDGTVTPGTTLDDPMFWYLIVAYAAIPAFCEEFVFRSVIIREYTDVSGELTALVMSTLTYAMLPLEFAALPEQLFCGFVLSAVTIITRSSLPAMVMRFLFNALGVVGEGTLLSIFEQSDGGAFVAFTAITLMLIALTFSLSEGERLCKFYVYTDVKPPRPIVEDKPTKLTDALFSPSFISCAALFVIAAIV